MEGLEYEADALGTYLCPAILVEVAEIDPVQPDMTRCWQVQTGEQRQQCRLAGTRRPDHGDRIARINAETDVRKYGQTTLRAANLFADLMCRKYGTIGWLIRHA